MDYHALTKKCDGMCDSCECPPAEPHPSCKTRAGCSENGCLGWCDEYRPDPALKPDIDALKKRLAEDQAFAAQVTGAEFECLGDPSLCTNPRGCACVPDSKTPNARLTGPQRVAHNCNEEHDHG